MKSQTLSAFCIHLITVIFLALLIFTQNKNQSGDLIHSYIIVRETVRKQLVKLVT